VTPGLRAFQIPVVLGSVLVIGAYLAGSIPFGYLVGRFVLGVDVRQVGSGNIGGTNVARAGGRKLGIAVIVLDALKAIVPILIARRVLGDAPGAELVVVAVAVAAFVGHLFPVWLGFRGGKGVATALGIFAVLAPWAAVAGIAVYAAAYLATRISSVGSLSGTIACAGTTFALNGPSRPVSWAGVALAALIFLRHRENIRRILSGEEKRKMRV
jgi:glycerol-3-phosphate acyltransferase PlsY